MLARREDAVGVERVFHFLVQAAHCMIIEIERARYLIHPPDMGAIFAIAICSGTADFAPIVGSTAMNGSPTG